MAGDGLNKNKQQGKCMLIAVQQTERAQLIYRIFHVA